MIRCFSLAIALAIALPAMAQSLPAAPVASRTPDLVSALQAARAVDPTLARATADRDSAQEYIPIARARLLPQISFQGTYQELHQTTKQTATSLEQTFRGPSRSATISMRQPIYRPRDWAGLDIGRRQAEYGELKLVSAESDLWYRTASAWVDVLVVRDVREAYARTVESVEMAAAQERQRYERGEGTRDAVAESAAQLALARGHLDEASFELQARIDAFNLLTQMNARDFSAFRLPSPESLAQLPEEAESLLARIIDANPEVGAARQVVSVNELRLQQASVDHRPTLDLVASANRAENDSTNTLGLQYQNLMIGVQVQLPIYAGGGLMASERQAAANMASARADLDATIQKLKTQFMLDWSAQGGQFERARAALELVKAGRETRRAAQFSIRAGLRTWTDLGSAELLLSQRESDLLTMTGAFLKTQARLLSLLPATDPAWEQWTTQLAQLARR